MCGDKVTKEEQNKKKLIIKAGLVTRDNSF